MQLEGGATADQLKPITLEEVAVAVSPVGCRRNRTARSVAALNSLDSVNEGLILTAVDELYEDLSELVGVGRELRIIGYVLSTSDLDTHPGCSEPGFH